MKFIWIKNKNKKNLYTFLETLNRININLLNFSHIIFYKIIVFFSSNILKSETDDTFSVFFISSSCLSCCSTLGSSWPAIISRSWWTSWWYPSRGWSRQRCTPQRSSASWSCEYHRRCRQRRWPRPKRTQSSQSCYFSWKS